MGWIASFPWDKSRVHIGCVSEIQKYIIHEKAKTRKRNKLFRLNLRLNLRLNFDLFFKIEFSIEILKKVRLKKRLIFFNLQSAIEKCICD